MTVVPNESRARCALFVDFDNVYSGLRRLDEKAAVAFATEPDRWLGWLENGHDAGGGRGRRFLVRNVYLNPARYGKYRAIYTRAGFRTVDCPSLTSQSKNSADIYMVVDILDALSSATLYEEFVIASTDADFTPVLHRLRAHDRRSTLVIAGVSASAYRAVCDSYIAPQTLADAALGEDATAEPPVASTDDEGRVALPPPPAGMPMRQPAETPGEASRERIQAAAQAVRDAVRAADRPIVSAAAAHAALAVDPKIKELEWYGSGGFRAFLALHVADVVYAGDPPGYVLDPQRHTAADIPHSEHWVHPELTELQRVVCASTGAPALGTSHYTGLFTALADELHEARFHRNETSKRVRDRTDLLGASVSRTSINAVQNALLYSGVNMSAETTPLEFAEAWASILVDRCESAALVLTSDDRAAIFQWVTAGLRGES